MATTSKLQLVPLGSSNIGAGGPVPGATVYPGKNAGIFAVDFVTGPGGGSSLVQLTMEVPVGASITVKDVPSGNAVAVLKLVFPMQPEEVSAVVTVLQAWLLKHPPG